MKTLYLDLGMGASGDMLAASLLELLPDREKFIKELTELRIPEVSIEAVPAEKCGIRGTHFSVKVNGKEEVSVDYHEHEHEGAPEHDHPHHHEHEHEHNDHHEHEHIHDHEDGHHHHHHSNLESIRHIVNDLPVSEKVKNDVIDVYNLIAEAESNAHGTSVSEVHFHEVGSMDAIADITAVCMLMEKIAPKQVIASPIHVGSGKVVCAHGILPVPAPATAFILKGLPMYSGSIEGELCTPTGAALLKHFVTSFGSMPMMRVESIGYGLGSKDYPAANCLRSLLGETDDSKPEDTMYELSCNLDDITAEKIGFAMDALLEAGAADVWTQAIGMKKNRPGVLLTVLCDAEKKDEMISLLFKHTSTFGIRETEVKRKVLERHSETVITDVFGPMRKKTAEGYGSQKVKWEYDDLARAAKEKNISIDEVLKKLE